MDSEDEEQIIVERENPLKDLRAINWEYVVAGQVVFRNDLDDQPPLLGTEKIESHLTINQESSEETPLVDVKKKNQKKKSSL